MASTVTIDLRHIGRGLDIPLRQIQAVVELLDEGNTVPFITRYRKDQTGGLDEEQIRQLQSRLTKLRLLADRKQTILRSIEAQGKLSEKLAQQVQTATSAKRLEDLYLPYKPKKQTLATLARSRGLEELAQEILAASPTCADLDARAGDFISTDRQVPTAADALLGAGHILAEEFSERADLRQRLREILQRSGAIVAAAIAGDPAPPPAESSLAVSPAAPGATAGLSSSAESTVGQANRGTLVAVEGVAPAPPPAAPAESSLAVSPAAPGATAGLSSSAESTVGQANRGTLVAVEGVAPAPPPDAPAESSLAVSPAVPGATAGLSSSAESTVGQANRGTLVAVEGVAPAPPPAAPAESSLAVSPAAPGATAGLSSSAESTVGQANRGTLVAVEGVAPAPPPAAPAESSLAVSPAAPGATAGLSSSAESTVGQANRGTLVAVEGVAPAPPPDAPAESSLAVSPAAPGATAGLSSSAESTVGQANRGTLVAVEGVAPAPPPAARAKRAKTGKAAARLSQKELKKKRLEEQRIKAFRDYFHYSEELRKMPPHRILAINRGERAKVLRVKIECDIAAMHAAIDELLVPPGHPHADYLRGCARDSLARLILPGLEREARRELTDRAETHAVEVFAKNLRNLLLQPPVRGRRVLAVDPGFKSGCKLAALDEFGNLLAHDVIYLVGRAERRQEGRTRAANLMRQFQLTAAVIGNGTACRQSEDFFAELIASELKEQGVAYVIVNEAGASVYSTSQLGREEFPDYDATLRGAISIGRRLQDPLSELVKIEPGNIGVGLYQHDVKAKHLQASLDEVVESCVNYVGVDVNTASPALLRYVSGMNQLTARRLYEHRREHGPFRNRQQLRAVPGIGEATFVQAAGFLKIAGGDNPLDATWIHPESYAVASRALERLGAAAETLREKDGAAALAPKIAAVDLEAMAKELEVGTLTLRDILSQLVRPGRDPREDLPQPVFRRGVLKIEDLAPGMEVTGTVLNVVDFGCFVDIGMHDSGLVHVSHLADRFVRDPHEVVAVGDIVKTWVLAVDKERRRVSLSMIAPGTERQRRGPRGEKPAADASGGPAAAPPRGDQREKRPYQKRPEGQGRGQGQGQGQGQAGGRSGGPPPSRPPRPRGGPPYGKSRSSSGPHDRPPPPKPRPKIVVPITEAMKKGKEPMRTFGDLVQFFGHNRPQEEKDVKSKGGQQEKAPPPAGGAGVSPVLPPETRQPPVPPDETLAEPAPPIAAAVEAVPPGEDHAPAAPEAAPRVPETAKTPPEASEGTDQQP